MTFWPEDLQRRAGGIAAFVCAIWIVTGVNVALFGGHLVGYGIEPRTKEGLIGIVVAPFLHGGLDHLLANTAGIFIFGGLVMLGSERHFWAVTLIGGLAVR